MDSWNDCILGTGCFEKSTQAFLFFDAQIELKVVLTTSIDQWSSFIHFYHLRVALFVLTNLPKLSFIKSLVRLKSHHFLNEKHWVKMVSFVASVTSKNNFHRQGILTALKARPLAVTEKDNPIQVKWYLNTGMWASVEDQALHTSFSLWQKTIVTATFIDKKYYLLFKHVR